jgi:uncharacterized membrane protein (Fun14 family)
MIVDGLTSMSVTIGGGFLGGLLLGYTLKKVVKLLAVVVGLFLAGLVYLQYQQLASFNWDKIEGTISTIANATTNTFNDHNIDVLATTNLGIPLTGGVSRICDWLHKGGNKSWIKTMFLHEISEHPKFF